MRWKLNHVRHFDLRVPPPGSSRRRIVHISHVCLPSKRAYTHDGDTVVPVLRPCFNCQQLPKFVRTELASDFLLQHYEEYSGIIIGCDATNWCTNRQEKDCFRLVKESVKRGDFAATEGKFVSTVKLIHIIGSVRRNEYSFTIASPDNYDC